jgi:hypothetical protein
MQHQPLQGRFSPALLARADCDAPKPLALGSADKFNTALPHFQNASACEI